jgi:hypothetical protein
LTSITGLDLLAVIDDSSRSPEGADLLVELFALVSDSLPIGISPIEGVVC